MAEKKEETPVTPQPVVVTVDNKMYDQEQVAPDGHVNLTKEDIKNRA